MAEPKQYPKVKHHATKPPVTVASKEEESQLDDSEWKDSPADVTKPHHDLEAEKHEVKAHEETVKAKEEKLAGEQVAHDPVTPPHETTFESAKSKKGK